MKMETDRLMRSLPFFIRQFGDIEVSHLTDERVPDRNIAPDLITQADFICPSYISCYGQMMVV
jgi:hypothetical protein